MKLTHPAKLFISIFDVLKDVITETTIEFGEYVVRIQAMDPQKATCISLNLYGLEIYENVLGTLHIGVFVPYIYRLIRNADENTMIHMRIEPEDVKTLWLSLRRRSEDEPYSNIMVRSIEMPVQTIEGYNDSDIAFSLNTKMFKRTLKELSHVNEEIDLTVLNHRVFLSTAGPMGTVQTELFDVKWLYHYPNDKGDPMEKRLPIKYIDKFLNPKFQPTVDLWVTKDGLLRLIYSFDCGTMSISIAPLTEQS